MQRWKIKKFNEMERVVYVFLFGRVGDVLHGVKLNARPTDFLGFLSKLKDKRKSTGDDYQHLDELLKTFGNIKTDDGSGVYNILKGSPKVYKGNYRTYKLNSLTYISEVFLEKDFLKDFFTTLSIFTRKKSQSYKRRNKRR